MARDIESLTLRMSADLRRFEKSMAQMSAIADKRLTAVERQALQSQRNLSRIMEKAGADMVAGLQRGLAELAPVLAGAFSVAQVTRYADAWTSGRNSLAAAGVATTDLAGRQEELLRIANESRTSTEATIGLYSRLTIATQELGLSSQDTLRLTELLNKSFASSGGSAQEAASAALQLSQALASGTLQGDELRSLRENAPLIAKAIADSMGVSIGALKQLGAEGKITAQVVTQALFAASADIEGRFQATQVTVGQALTILDNQLGAFVGQTNESLSATQRMAQGIVALANSLDDVTDAVIVAATAIGATLASRAVGTAVVGFTALRAQIALTNIQLAAAELQAGLAAGSLGRMSVAGVAAAGSMRGLSAAMSFFGGGVGLLVTALATGIALLAVNAGRAKRETEELAETVRHQARAAGVAADETSRLAGEITATDKWAAGLTGQVHLLADAHYRAAAGAKAQAIETARLRLEEAQGTLQTARTQYDRRRRVDEGLAAAGPRVDAYGRPLPDNGQTGSQRTVRSTEYTSLTTATATVRSLADNLNRLLNAPLEQFKPDGQGGGGGGGGGGAGMGGGATAARQQTDDLRRDLSAVQDALLTDAERAAQLLAERAETIRKAVAAGLITPAEGAELRAAADGVGLQPLERREITPLDGTDARELADSLREGARQAAQELEDRSRAMARNFVDVLASDDWAQAAGDRFKQAAFNGLEDLLTNIFSQIAGGGRGPGGLFGAIGSLFGPIGGAVGGLFGGLFRANGGPVRAGQPYIVGERRPEVFVPKVNGTIIPSVNAAVAGMRTGGASAAPVIHFSPTIDARGADMAAVRRLEETLRQQGKDFSAHVVSVMARRGRFKTGSR